VNDASARSETANVQLVDAHDGRVLVERLEIAATFWQRFCGWQFRSRPDEGTGLLLAPCNSIHTCWMRFAIDVAFFDQAGQVVHVASGVRPWRVVWPVRGAAGAIETPAGTARLAVGMRLRVIADPERCPRAVRRLASTSTPCD
jgi:uncharacterized protein